MSIPLWSSCEAEKEQRDEMESFFGEFYEFLDVRFANVKVIPIPVNVIPVPVISASVTQKLRPVL